MIDSKGKMKTKHSVMGQFGTEYPAICNHCRVMTAWSSKTWKFCEQFCFFRKSTPYMINIFKILFRKFLPPHRSALLCLNVVKIYLTGNRQSRALFTW